MQASKLFQSQFSQNSLEDIYHRFIKPKATVGIDRINRDSFENQRIKHLGIINRKVLNGSYKFTLFKQRLISKGRDKLPRIISIPTIRDKVTLKALNELIFKVFKKDINNQIVQSIVDQLKISIGSGKYDYFVKLDIKNFYPTIEHDLLLRKIKRRIRKKEIVSLIQSALLTRTVPNPQVEIEKPKKGIPQGLSISNVLASIYLMDFDKKYNATSECDFFRYVDDMLILTKKEHSEKLINEIIEDLDLLDLELNKDKFLEGDITKEFEFLGYKNTKNGLTVRKGSIEKLQDSIIQIISQYNYSRKPSIKKLEWTLNLKITGCIYEKKKYGWLFFFSQIDDIKLLFQLDWFVKKMLLRFEIDESEMRVKRFVKTFHEITKNLSSTRFIPNFSEYDYEKQREILKEIFSIEGVDGMGDNQIDKLFSEIIFKTIRDLERDIQSFS